MTALVLILIAALLGHLWLRLLDSWRITDEYLLDIHRREDAFRHPNTSTKRLP